MNLTSAGSFKAVRSKVPRRRSARAPAAPSAPRARSATAAALALVGAEFEEELISWKVVGVDWSAELEQVVVWYYDVAMAADKKNRRKRGGSRAQIRHRLGAFGVLKYQWGPPVDQKERARVTSSLFVCFLLPCCNL
jgi:hypothetical protein